MQFAKLCYPRPCSGALFAKAQTDSCKACVDVCGGSWFVLKLMMMMMFIRQTERLSWPLPALIHWEVELGGTSMKEVITMSARDESSKGRRRIWAFVRRSGRAVQPRYSWPRSRRGKPELVNSAHDQRTCIIGSSGPEKQCSTITASDLRCQTPYPSPSSDKHRIDDHSTTALFGRTAPRSHTSPR